VVEDGAQALGALDRASGSSAAAYSFYPTKNLGGIGDGGAVVTDDPALAERVRRLRRHGDVGEYEHTEVAGNSRMSEIEATALRVGLRHLRVQNDRRREIAGAYRAAAPARAWQAPHDRHVYHLCVMREPDREEFRARVPFQTAVHYPRALGAQPAYAQFARWPSPESESWAAECVSLPCFPEMTDDEIEGVCHALR
ncbi:MAG: DegT/DnrJ/EryC1/StrS family aminotransferase, partial [Acidimicrobiia bacterium]